MRRFLVLLLIAPFTQLPAQTMEFILSDGLYRVPYADGTVVSVTNGYMQHNPEGMYDMSGVLGAQPYHIVAAADGILRGIQDSNTVECVCCWEDNNYVIIEHPNGEWTNYSHFATGTVTALGHSVGDSVEAGDVLGEEGSVGCSSGPHLHFVVAKATGFAAIGGFLDGVTRIPQICGISNNYFTQSQSYIAGPCDDNCPQNVSVNQIVPELGISIKRADEQIETETTIFPQFMNLEAGSAVVYRAGDRIIINPGFDAFAGCSFRAVIKTCNQDF